MLIVKLLGAAGIVAGTVFVVVLVIVVVGIMCRQGPKSTSDPGSIRNVGINPHFLPPTLDAITQETKGIEVVDETGKAWMANL